MNGLAFMGKSWDAFKDNRAFQDWVSEWARLLIEKALYPGAVGLFFGGTRTWHRLAVGLEDGGFSVEDTVMWTHAQGFPKGIDISKAIDKAAGVEREVVGEASGARNGNGRNNDYGTYGSAKDGKYFLTAPATDAARTWAGYNVSLKPAWEPCLVVRAPHKETYAQLALKYGTGALNIDGTRIPTDGENLARNNGGTDKLSWGGTYGAGKNTAAIRQEQGMEPQGRWPANIIFDEDAAAELDRQSGVRKSSGIFNARDHHDGEYVQGVTNFPGRGTPGTMYADSGGASRFFFVPKASKRDRGEGNTHPTCKPTQLTEYLAKLILPPVPARLLIPFAGSGSEVLGAIRAGWQDITAIEISPEYCTIARDRIAKLQPPLL